MRNFDVPHNPEDWFERIASYVFLPNAATKLMQMESNGFPDLTVANGVEVRVTKAMLLKAGAVELEEPLIPIASSIEQVQTLMNQLQP